MAVRAPLITAGSLNVFILAVACAMVCGCGSRGPFPMVTVSGRIRYEDGGLIPAERLRVLFRPQAAPRDAKTHPRAGEAHVDVTTGEFGAVTTVAYGDGLIVGKHRVVVTALDQQNMPLPAVPPEYSDPTRTPLEVDTADSPFDLKVKRPN